VVPSEPSSTWTLTASNDLGDTAQATWTLAAVPPPVIESFTASPPTLPLNSPGQLLPAFSGGTGTIGDLGPVESGVPVTIGPLHATTSYTLTVTNLAGAAVARSLTVPLVGPGTWALLGPAMTMVLHHSATLLADGRVLLMAHDRGYPGLDELALYDPSLATLASGPDPGSNVVSRAHHAAVRLADGQVLVMGGTDRRSPYLPLESAFLIDVEASRVVATGMLPAKLGSPRAVALSDGGALVAQTWALRYVERVDHYTELYRYDVASGRFTTVGKITDASVEHLVQLVDGTILLVNVAHLSPERRSFLFDPRTGTVQPTGSLGHGRDGGTTATALGDGRVLISGGGTTWTTREPPPPAELYDPTTGTYSDTGMPAIERIGGAAALVPDGRVLLAGGADEATAATWPGAETYDPATGLFSPTGWMSRPRDALTLTVIADGRPLAVGGGGGNNDPGPERYEP